MKQSLKTLEHLEKVQGGILSVSHDSWFESKDHWHLQESTLILM